MTYGFLAYRLKNGAVKGTGCQFGGHPQGVCTMIVEFLQKTSSKEHERMARRMEEVEVRAFRSCTDYGSGSVVVTIQSCNCHAVNVSRFRRPAYHALQSRGRLPLHR